MTLRAQISSVTATPSQETYLVYRATSPSGKAYIGVTRKTLAERRRAHMSVRNVRRNWGLPFRHALRKYGDAMRWEVLESGIRGHTCAVERETHWIVHFGSDDLTRGYNANRGGQGPSRTVAERLQRANAQPVLRSDGRPFVSGRDAERVMGLTFDKVSRAVRRRRVCCGFTFTRITYEDYLAAKRIWEAQHGANAPEPAYKKQCGWHVTEAQRQKLREAKKGRPHSEQHRRSRLKAISKRVFRSDGAVFDSIGEAAAAVGSSRNQLCYAIKQRRPLRGLVYGLEPLSSEHLAQIFEEHGRKAGPRPIRRSDGEIYPNMTVAAAAVGRRVSTLSQAIKTGRPVRGFTFSKVASEPYTGL